MSWPGKSGLNHQDTKCHPDYLDWHHLPQCEIPCQKKSVSSLRENQFIADEKQSFHNPFEKKYQNRKNLSRLLSALSPAKPLMPMPPKCWSRGWGLSPQKKSANLRLRLKSSSSHHSFNCIMSLWIFMDHIRYRGYSWIDGNPATSDMCEKPKRKSVINCQL